MTTTTWEIITGTTTQTFPALDKAINNINSYTFTDIVSFIFSILVMSIVISAFLFIIIYILYGIIKLITKLF